MSQKHFLKAMKTISIAIPTLSFLNPRKVQPTNYYLIKVIEALPFAENILHLPRAKKEYEYWFRLRYESWPQKYWMWLACMCIGPMDYEFWLFSWWWHFKSKQFELPIIILKTCMFSNTFLQSRKYRKLDFFPHSNSAQGHSICY